MKQKRIHIAILDSGRLCHFCMNSLKSGEYERIAVHPKFKTDEIIIFASGEP